MTRAYDLLLERHWAIMPDFLQKMAKISLRESEDWAVEAGKMGMPVKYTRKATQRNGVAIIPVTGPIFPKANLMTEMSGATSLNILSHDLAQAIEDSEIKAIILDINSPGGVAFGPAEMAEEIRKASAVKPVVAYVSGMACSAAYWLAAGASEIVAHKSAILGSIGVVTAIPVQEEPDINGDMYVEIVSTNATNKRPDPRTEAGLKEIRRELDDIETQFIGDIATLRKTTREKILSDFGLGGVLIADDAVRVGMADRLGSFEDLLTEMSNRPQNSKTGDDPMSTQKDPGQDPKNPAADNTEALKKAKEEGIAEGRRAEQERLAGIDAAALPGFETIVNAAKADGKSTGADVAMKIVEAQKKQGSDYMTTLKTESEKQPKVDPSASNEPPADPQEDTTLSLEERVKATWNKDAKVRTEFRNNFDAYLAQRKAEESGRHRTRK